MHIKKWAEPTPPLPLLLLLLLLPLRPTTSLYKPRQFLSRPLSRRWTALSLRWTAFSCVQSILRFAHVLLVRSYCILLWKNKVLRVVSSHFGEVWRFIRQKIQFGESVDVPEVVDFRQQRANKSKWT